jgi:hypothetical protein
MDRSHTGHTRYQCIPELCSITAYGRQETDTGHRNIFSICLHTPYPFAIMLDSMGNTTLAIIEPIGYTETMAYRDSALEDD